MTTLDWSSVRAASGMYSFVPKRNGVYAFCRVHRCHGMPLDLNVVYVGKATNLRRRFREHLNPLAEHNAALFQALQERNIEFWFAKCSDIDTMEKTLIESTTPLFNQRIG